MKIATTLFVIAPLVIFLATPAHAWQLFLERDIGVNGLYRYCRYSDGNTYSFNAIDICPLTIDGSPPGLGEGTGFLQGEYRDGMTKVCVYNVLGQKKGLRIGSVDLCPLNQQLLALLFAQIPEK